MKILVSLLAFLLVSLVGVVGVSHSQSIPAKLEEISKKLQIIQRNHGPRLFYLTSESHIGNTVETACDPGFHFASLYEILDPSNFKYYTTNPNALVRGDQGSGPPTGSIGWVRTGNEASYSNPEAGAGLANCRLWTSNYSMDHGTIINLQHNWIRWDLPFPEHDYPARWWNAYTSPCDVPSHVWCVQD